VSAIGFIGLRYNSGAELFMTMKNPEDDTLFDEAMNGVKPLKHKLVARIPVRSPQRESASLPEETDAEFGEQLSYLRSGIQNTALQKLRRGKFQIEADARSARTKRCRSF
jgi:DNA-nicking Smr family endonuclease